MKTYQCNACKQHSVAPNKSSSKTTLKNSKLKHGPNRKPKWCYEQRNTQDLNILCHAASDFLCFDKNILEIESDSRILKLILFAILTV